MKRSAIRTLLVGCALLQLIAGLIFFAPFTEIGSKALLFPLAKFLPIEIEYAGGSLFGELHLSSVKFDTPEVQLNIQNAEVELKLACLLRSTLCLRRLGAQHIEINWEGGLWRSADLQARLSIFGSKVEIDELHSEDVLLQLIQRGEPASDSVISPVSLPVELIVNQAKLDRVAWEIYGVKSTHQTISLSGEWIDDVLTLHQVELELGADELGNLRLKGGITFAGDWPFELDALANFSDQPTAASVLSAFLSSEQIQTLPEFSSGLTLHSPLNLFASGTLLEQSFLLKGAMSGLGYDALQLSFSGRHLANVQKIYFDHIEINDSNTHRALSVSAELAVAQQYQWALKAQTNKFALPTVNDWPNGYLTGAIEADGNFLADGWTVALHDIDLQGEVNGLPAKIEGRFGVNQAMKLSDGNLLAAINGATLQLASRRIASEGVDLKLAVEDLSRWLPDSKGALELTGVLSEDLGSAKVRGNFSDIHWQDFAVKQVTLDGVVDLGMGHTFQLTAELAEVSVNATQLKALSISATGRDGEQLLQLDSTGDIEFSLAGVADFSLLNSSGSLALHGDLQSVAALLPEAHDFRGKLLLTAQANWDASDSVRINGDLQFMEPELRREFEGNQTAKIGWDRLNVGFERDSSGLQLKALGVKDERILLSVDLFLPGQIEKTLKGQLEFHQLDVGPFQAFVPKMSRLSGVLNGQVVLSGSREMPLGYGELKLSEGGFSVLNNPTEVDAVELGLVMDGDTAVISGDLLLGGGRVDIDGILGFNPAVFVELQLSGKREKLLFPPSVQLEASHNIKLLATADLLEVTGDLTVHEGVFEHEQLSEGGVALSEDVVIVGYTKPQPAPFDMAMDVQVKIEDHFKVVGSVVDVTVGGDLHLLQERGRPLQLFGNLNVVGGELRAYQQHLKVRRGTVAFSGVPKNPALDMRAERIIANQNLTVGLELTGTLEDPVLEIYSDPIMPRTETLSYLIRGRGLDVNAGADGTAFALSMGASLVNQTGLLQQFDKIPGVNSVELSTDGSDDDTTATVSGYIGNRIYLGYGVGLYEPINVLTARLYLQTRLWVEVVSSLENSLDLYYSFDIE